MLTAQRSHGRVNRNTLVIMLAAMLGFLGSLTLTAAVTWYDVKPNQHTTDSATTLLSETRTQGYKSPTSTAVTSPGDTSKPSLSATFPSQLWQQLAVLQSQNRFLFNGNRGLPEIALTFDDGPSPDYTPQILSILQEYNVKATFFCIGQQVSEYSDVVKQEYIDGNVVGNHSWSHPNLGLLSSDEILRQINRTSDIIQQTIGTRPTFFRPPYGVFDANILAQANSLELTTVIWNDESRDWSLPGVSVIVSRTLGLAANGAIILLHDGGGDRTQTVEALPTIITSLRAQGYTFVSLQQLVNDLPKNPAANQAPASAATPTPPPTFTPEPVASPSPLPTSSPTDSLTPSAFIRRQEGGV